MKINSAPLFCITIPFFLTAMDPSSQVASTQQKKLDELEELKKQVTRSEHYDSWLHESYKPNTPPSYVIYMKRQVMRNPALEIKDIKNSQTPLIVYLAEDDEYHEILKFMLDHGAKAEVNEGGHGKNAALYKALWARYNKPALKNIRLLLERGAPAQFTGPWYVREPEKQPGIQLLIEFGAKIDEFVITEWSGCGGLP